LVNILCQIGMIASWQKTNCVYCTLWLFVCCWYWW